MRCGHKCLILRNIRDQSGHTNVVGCFLLFVFYSPPNSYINTQRVILTYECQALVWLASSKLFLFLISYFLLCSPFVSVFLPFLILYVFLSFLLHGWCVAGWLVSGVLSSFSYSPSLKPRCLFLFILTGQPCLCPSCLALGW